MIQNYCECCFLLALQCSGLSHSYKLFVSVFLFSILTLSIELCFKTYAYALHSQSIGDSASK